MYFLLNVIRNVKRINQINLWRRNPFKESNSINNYYVYTEISRILY